MDIETLQTIEDIEEDTLDGDGELEVEEPYEETVSIEKGTVETITEIKTLSSKTVYDGEKYIEEKEEGEGEVEKREEEGEEKEEEKGEKEEEGEEMEEGEKIEEEEEKIGEEKEEEKEGEEPPKKVERVESGKGEKIEISSYPLQLLLYFNILILEIYPIYTFVWLLIKAIRLIVPRADFIAEICLIIFYAFVAYLHFYLSTYGNKTENFILLISGGVLSVLFLIPINIYFLCFQIYVMIWDIVVNGVCIALLIFEIVFYLLVVFTIVRNKIGLKKKKNV